MVYTQWVMVAVGYSHHMMGVPFCGQYSWFKKLGEHILVETRRKKHWLSQHSKINKFLWNSDLFDKIRHKRGAHRRNECHQQKWLKWQPWNNMLVIPYYSDVIMDAIASQITRLIIVNSTVYSSVDQRKHQSSASLAFVWGIHLWPVNSPHKWPVTRKMFPFDDIIIPYVKSSNISRLENIGWQFAADISKCILLILYTEISK